MFFSEINATLLHYHRKILIEVPPLVTMIFTKKILLHTYFPSYKKLANVDFVNILLLYWIIIADLFLEVPSLFTLVFTRFLSKILIHQEHRGVLKKIS